MRPIFLVGFMGSGKSTLGKALSKATGLRFIDLDTYIECRYHANVRDIFAEKGESGFRDIEQRMIREVSDFEDVIVACGGGTPCFFNNMEVMNGAGLTVLLAASVPRLLERLKLGRRRRPLIAAMTDTELLFAGRRNISGRPPRHRRTDSRIGQRLHRALHPPLGRAVISGPITAAPFAWREIIAKFAVNLPHPKP